MLHQPASTFEPSQPAPASAQPFDAKRYLQRARELGLMVFPSISQSGRRLFGLCAYPGYSFGQGHRRLCEEFDDGGSTPTIFDALCADFDLDPADAAFNDKVNAICRARSHASTDGDKRLIELCKQAKAALEKDVVCTDIHCDLIELYEKSQPEKPTFVTAMGAELKETSDASTMRATLANSMSEWSRPAIEKYRARIANVVAYEKECARVGREIGLSRARAAEHAAATRAKGLIGDISELPATTHLGLSYKAALLPYWRKAGYGLDDEGEALAFSIADDARMLGAGGQPSHRARSPKRTPAPDLVAA